MRPWTRRYKEAILRSRVDGTRLVAETLAGLRSPPRAMLSASAAGWYGDRGDALLTEESQTRRGLPGRGLPPIWEVAAQLAAPAGIRVVLLSLRRGCRPRGRPAPSADPARPARLWRAIRGWQPIHELDLPGGCGGCGPACRVGPRSSLAANAPGRFCCQVSGSCQPGCWRAISPSGIQRLTGRSGSLPRRVILNSAELAPPPGSAGRLQGRSRQENRASISFVRPAG